MLRRRHAGIRHVKLRFVRREDEAVGHVEVARRDRGLLRLRVESEDVIALLLFRLPFGQSIRRVGEPNGAVRLHHNVIRRIEFLPVIFAHQRFHRTIFFRYRDTAACVLGGDKAALQIQRVAVDVIARLAERRHTIGLGPFLQFVCRNIAENQKTIGVPHWTFGEHHVTCELLHTRICRDTIAKLVFVFDDEGLGIRRQKICRRKYSQQDSQVGFHWRGLDDGTAWPHRN